MEAEANFTIQQVLAVVGVLYLCMSWRSACSLWPSSMGY